MLVSGYRYGTLLAVSEHMFEYHHVSTCSTTDDQVAFLSCLMVGFQGGDEAGATTGNKAVGSGLVLSPVVEGVVSMIQHVSLSGGRSKWLWSVLSLLVVLSFALAACGGGDSTSASSAQANSSQASNASQSSTSGPTVVVTITEKLGSHDIYSFDPQTITIKMGTTVKWVNNSDENHLLASDPAGIFTASSMVRRNGGSDNTYQMVFNTPGTYHYTSTLVQRLNNQPEGVNSSATGTITVTS
jgi:plastocyanin